MPKIKSKNKGKQRKDSASPYAFKKTDWMALTLAHLKAVCHHHGVELSNGRVTKSGLSDLLVANRIPMPNDSELKKFVTAFEKSEAPAEKPIPAKQADDEEAFEKFRKQVLSTPYDEQLARFMDMQDAELAARLGNLSNMPPATVQAQPSKGTSAFCTYCGTAIGSSFAFCSKCGKPIPLSNSVSASSGSGDSSLKLSSGLGSTFASGDSLSSSHSPHEASLGLHINSSYMSNTAKRQHEAKTLCFADLSDWIELRKPQKPGSDNTIKIHGIEVSTSSKKGDISNGLQWNTAWFNYSEAVLEFHPLRSKELRAYAASMNEFFQRFEFDSVYCLDWNHRKRIARSGGNFDSFSVTDVVLLTPIAKKATSESKPLPHSVKRVCNQFYKSGSCLYGDNCIFQHSQPSSSSSSSSFSSSSSNGKPAKRK